VTDARLIGQWTVMERLKRPPALPAPARPRFDDVYQQDFAYVWQTLRRLGVRPSDLEDLAHDVFVVVHRRLEDFDPTRALRPWLFGIAYRVASEHRRRRPPDRPAEGPETDVDDLADQAPSPERILTSGEARRRVAKALERLPLDQRGVLVLHDIDGVSVPEIARALELPLNTVYSRLRLGRSKFLAAIGAALAEGEKP
jgi:RNA polymerase sigma-70 factor, ECF subfamily